MLLNDLLNLSMEKLGQLINRLREQFEKNAPASQMMSTVKLIESEISHSSNRPGSVLSTAKVAVVMPSSSYFQNGILKEADLEKAVPPRQAAPVSQVAEHSLSDHEGWNYDPLKEIPTLSHQELPRDLNDVIGNNDQSLNDRLKMDITELGDSLKGEPVKDLRKAIGINDRYVFISELFRGDEAMYERCIKTINNFRILPEAEYWMERELKLKLGWDDTKESSRHFYQLVRRRFS